MLRLVHKKLVVVHNITICFYVRMSLEFKYATYFHSDMSIGHNVVLKIRQRPFLYAAFLLSVHTLFWQHHVIVACAFSYTIAVSIFLSTKFLHTMHNFLNCLNSQERKTEYRGKQHITMSTNNLNQNIVHKMKKLFLLQWNHNREKIWIMQHMHYDIMIWKLCCPQSK